MKWLIRIALAVSVITIAFALWLRIAPPVPDDLDVDITAARLELQPGWAPFCPVQGWRYEDAFPRPLSAVRDTILGTPQTTLVHGNNTAGPMLFITESGVFGIPVYTTIAMRQTAPDTETPNSHYCIVSRSAVPVLGRIHANRVINRAIDRLYGNALMEPLGQSWHVNQYPPILPAP